MKLTVLSRPGCHLCEIAIDELHHYLADRDPERPGIEVEIIDIETDDQLHRDYLERIPVFKLGQVEISEFSFEPGALESALGGHAQGRG